jgi:hypothetical protein
MRGKRLDTPLSPLGSARLESEQATAMAEGALGRDDKGWHAGRGGALAERVDHAAGALGLVIGLWEVDVLGSRGVGRPPG